LAEEWAKRSLEVVREKECWSFGVLGQAELGTNMGKPKKNHGDTKTPREAGFSCD
jgi:hypothetical protein